MWFEFSLICKILLAKITQTAKCKHISEPAAHGAAHVAASLKVHWYGTAPSQADTSTPSRTMWVYGVGVGQVRVLTHLLHLSCYLGKLQLENKSALWGEGVWALMRSICCLLVCNYPNHPPSLTHPSSPHPAPPSPPSEPPEKPLTDPGFEPARGGWVGVRRWWVFTNTTHFVLLFNVPCPWGPCKLPRLQRGHSGWQRGVTLLSVFYRRGGVGGRLESFGCWEMDWKWVRNVISWRTSARALYH